MLVTGCLTCTDSLEGAVHAAKVFSVARVCSILDGSLLLTVNQTSEVSLLAIETLVERAAMQGVFLRLTVVKISGVIDAAIRQNALILGTLKSLSFGLVFQQDEGAKHIGDDFDMEGVDRCRSTRRTVQEAKAEANSWSTALQELYQTSRMENVTTAKFDARPVTKVAHAHHTRISLVELTLRGTLRLQARETFALGCHSAALVST